MIRLDKAAVALAVTLLSSTSFAWTIHAGFEDGAIGTKAENTSDSFDGAAGRSTFSDDIKLLGQNAKLSILEGETGYGWWGGELKFPENLSEGDTVWFMTHVYFPEGFDHYSYSAGGRLKFMRIGTLNESGGNRGYNDLYIDTKGSANPFKWIYEGQNLWVDVGTQEDQIVKGRWESYEIMTTLSATPVSEGGDAEVMIWKNGVLLSHITDRKTLAQPTDYATRALLFTYWNGGSPQDQSMYVDEITITTDQPSNRDANGNPYIGGLVNKTPIFGTVTRD